MRDPAGQARCAPGWLPFPLRLARALHHSSPQTRPQPLSWAWAARAPSTPTGLQAPPCGPKRGRPRKLGREARIRKVTRAPAQRPVPVAAFSACKALRRGPCYGGVQAWAGI